MEFLIDSFQENDGEYHVMGICSGGSIKLSSKFLKVYENLLGSSEDGSDMIVARKNIKNINLVVKEIKAYGHTLDELPSGMSGELVLIGEKGIILNNTETLGVN
jgi:hypothetical protein